MPKKVQVIEAKKKLANGSNGKNNRVAAYCRVSTADEDQEKSFKSQIAFYTDNIKSNPNWEFAGIYADQALTGTKSTKRDEFNRMIEDALHGKIDIILTKSISRFGRNTVDTLIAVRQLKANGVAVNFEEERIDTDSMGGEFLLTILAAIAQQESENTSSHVNFGLKAKMERGEFCGLASIYGYDIDRKNNKLIPDPIEAATVKLIFDLYVGKGIGAGAIAKQLYVLKIKTPKGKSDHWHDSTIIGILKNEKYIGTLLQGKTYTIDPIDKIRKPNHGQSKQFYTAENHEAIIDEEIFNAAQEILASRGSQRGRTTQKYTFSSKILCGFCGSIYSRRSSNSGTKYQKTIWGCMTATKKGKENCIKSKAIREEVIEEAFVASYNKLKNIDSDVLEETLAIYKATYAANDSESALKKIEKKIEEIKRKLQNLLDLFLDEEIDKNIYNSKKINLEVELYKFENNAEEINEKIDEGISLVDKLKIFKDVLSKQQSLEQFDPDLFDLLIDHIEIGDKKSSDPYVITFIYKSGMSNSSDASKIKKTGKTKELQGIADNTCQRRIDDTRRDGLSADKKIDV